MVFWEEGNFFLNPWGIKDDDTDLQVFESWRQGLFQAPDGIGFFGHEPAGVQYYFIEPEKHRSQRHTGEMKKKYRDNIYL